MNKKGEKAMVQRKFDRKFVRAHASLALAISAFALVFALALVYVKYGEMGSGKTVTFVIIIDGFSADYLDNTPALVALAGKGLANLSAVTVMPSITPAAHASMLTGVDPPVHGIVDYNAKTLRTPTIMAYLRRQGIKSCFVAAKPGLAFLSTEADYRFDPALLSPDNGNASDADAKAMARSLELRQKGLCSLIIMNLPATDLIGHRYGPNSSEISQQLAYLNSMLDKFLQVEGVADGNIILTADHGMCPGSTGSAGGYHGTNESCSMRVPIIVKFGTTKKGGSERSERLSSVKDVYGLVMGIYG